MSGYGEIKDIRIITKENNVFAYLEYKEDGTGESAKKALELNGFVWTDGEPGMSVEISNPMQGKTKNAVYTILCKLM